MKHVSNLHALKSTGIFPGAQQTGSRLNRGFGRFLQKAIRAGEPTDQVTLDVHTFKSMLNPRLEGVQDLSPQVCNRSVYNNHRTLLLLARLCAKGRSKTPMLIINQPLSGVPGTRFVMCGQTAAQTTSSRNFTKGIVS